MLEQYLNTCLQLFGYSTGPMLRPDEIVRNIKKSAFERTMSHAEIYIIWVEGMAMGGFEMCRDIVKWAPMETDRFAEHIYDALSAESFEKTPFDGTEELYRKVKKNLKIFSEETFFQMFPGSVFDIEELFKLSEDIIQNESLEKFF